METRRIYCLVPAELAGRLHDLLLRHFRNDPEVEVVVERRGRDRRSGAERRAEAVPRDGAPEGEPNAAQRVADERRRILNRTGRRVGERRSPLVQLTAADLPELPRRARRYAGRLGFVERVAPSTERDEDLDTARLVTRIQAGESELFTELYMRYFDRVYGYLRLALNDRHEAEDVTQQVFLGVLEALGRYERRRQPFRAWLFSIARNQAVSSLRRRERLQVTDPSQMPEDRAAPEENGEDPGALRWVVDSDLLVLIERLPQPQRQVLVLVELMGLSVSEVALVLDRSPANVRMLKSRGLSFLRQRLRALGRAPERRGSRESQIYLRQATVLRRRRFALLRR